MNNFSDAELTHSEAAKKHGIVNTYTITHYKNCELYLRPGAEAVRKLLNNNRMITLSGYRNPDLNCMVGGSMTEQALVNLAGSTQLNVVREKAIHRLQKSLYSFADSAHMLFLALDFIAPEYGTPMEICNAIINSDIEYDQLIFEKGTWVHISFDPRKRMLRGMIDKRGVYTKVNGSI